MRLHGASSDNSLPCTYELSLTCSHGPIFVCSVSVTNPLVAPKHLICSLLFSRILGSDAIVQLPSQIDDDIAGWLRAANEKVAVRRLFERLGVVDDCTGNQTALTGVTNAGPAGPKGGDVARFGQFQNALIF